MQTQMPNITRTKAGGINWSLEVLEWLRHQINAGTSIKTIAAMVGCSTQSIHTCCVKYGIAKPVRIEEPPAVTADFATLMAGRRFEDVPVRRAGKPRPLSAPVGPITRLTPRRPVGRALDLDLGGV